MEREQAISFLLQAEPLGAERLGVLPIVGPALIGKSTFVEHVCDDERVRSHFSLILLYSGNDLKGETAMTFREHCPNLKLWYLHKYSCWPLVRARVCSILVGYKLKKLWTCANKREYVV